MKLFLLTLLCVASLNAFSQWNVDPTVNTPVSLALKSQNNIHSVTDTKGGIIMSWDDNRNSTTASGDIYAQRLNTDGNNKWAVNGIAVCNDAANQNSSSIVDAGNGSAIITWEDLRAGNKDIYAQKIDSSGNVLWTINGVAICTKTTAQKSPKIVSDNAGGAIIVWEDSVNNYWDIYAQRISSAGTVMWTSNGVAVCSAVNAQVNPKIDIDGLGGAVFTWQDKRNSTDYDIYAQRINNSGTALWATNGVVVCNAVNVQVNPRIEPDGANGAIIGWVDKRNGLDYNIYAQRINANGVAQWTANGITVCNATNNQSALDFKNIGSAGVLLNWKDARSGNEVIYAQLVSLTGVAQLTANGVKLSNALRSINPNTISDGLGGAIVAWQDSTAAGWEITSQKVNSMGSIQWVANGVAVSLAADDQVNVSQVTDGNGGAIYAWEDHRNGTDYDIYANHLFFNGDPTVGLKELFQVNVMQSRCFPNPITSQSIIQLKNNLNNLSWNISVYDTFGKLIQTEHVKNSEQFALNSNDYPAGIYFYCITLNSQISPVKGSFVSAK